MPLRYDCYTKKKVKKNNLGKNVFLTTTGGGGSVVRCSSKVCYPNPWAPLMYSVCLRTVQNTNKETGTWMQAGYEPARLGMNRLALYLRGGRLSTVPLGGLVCTVPCVRV